MKKVLGEVNTAVPVQHTILAVRQKELRTYSDIHSFLL